MSTGTTWTQELVWLIVNDCNFEKAKKTDLNIRSPYMEMNYLLSKSDTDRFQREAIARYYMTVSFTIDFLLLSNLLSI